MKNKICLLLTILCLTACGKDEDSPGNNGGGHSGSVTDVTEVTSTLTVDLFTDKACYKPGETVRFTADGTIPAGSKIRYRLLNEIIEEKELSGNSWEWLPPTTDFKGYIADIYQQTSDKKELIIGTIAIDVSSNWKRFPRYGFVAAFENNKTPEVIEEEMAYLNRHHINGVQFQDWHNKHHWPLGGTREKLDEVYRDIANRPVYTSVLKNYIDIQHQYGMKSIFYNLCYGVLEDAATDGVKEEWYVFSNPNGTGKDSHNLPTGWKSDIYLVDPGNTEWQNYITQRNDDVYANFDFDGYQIDQLGSRNRTRYDYNGKTINFPTAYVSFMEAMKKAHPAKTLIMNAVSSYGGQQIAGSGVVDFLYNETWDEESEFRHLRSIISANTINSNGLLNTVFAAYMNYNVANRRGEFNTPGIILTDAVMFALGGSHLELGGDHMLCKEYFPNNNLTMKADLKTAMIHYYDFLTGYQNLLRDGGNENTLQVTCNNGRMSTALWADKANPQQGKVAVYTKQVNNKQVIHLLNFTQANSNSWRDINGDMPEPALITKAELQFNYNNAIKKIWTASPDVHGGVPVELTFVQENGMVTLSLPSLKYWSILVIE